LPLNSCNGNDAQQCVFLGRLKRAGFSLADVQSDVVSPSCMYVLSPLTHSFVGDVLRYACPCVNQALLHFRRSYLKANKIRKSERTRKVECTYHFWKCADAVYPKLSKSSHACRNHN